MAWSGGRVVVSRAHPPTPTCVHAYVSAHTCATPGACSLHHLLPVIYPRSALLTSKEEAYFLETALFRKWFRRLPCFLNPLGADHRDQTAGAMEHSQVSCALFLFLPFMVVPFMAQRVTTEPCTAREMALSSMIYSQTCNYPDEGTKPGSTQIL